MRSTVLTLLTVTLSYFVALSLGVILLRDDAGLTTLSDNSPETWPAPNATGGNAWTAAFSRAQALVAQMTLEEKVNLITGHDGRCTGNTGAVERLGIPVLCLNDGPAGVGRVLGVSQFPAGQTVAATWDRDLIYQRGHAMGQEFYDQGVNIALSPVTGGPLGRSPRGGRNFEGFFDDAYGTGEAAYATIKGMQDAGVLTTAKHFIGYEQETSRNPYAPSDAIDPTDVQVPISSNIDNKALHELYLWGFAEAVRAGTGYVMCSYNEVNGTHACANAYTQNNILKDELNFQGGIMSDWGGVWSDAETINGGLDISMPGVALLGYFGLMWGDGLVSSIESGLVSESRVDDAVRHSPLTPWISSGQADNPPPAVTYNVNPIFVAEDAHWRDVRKIETMALIRQIGEDSATLLKNVDGALPLHAPKVLAIIGADAGANELGALGGQGTNEYPTWNINGTLTLGGGSGWVIPPTIVTPYEAINYRARRMNSQVYAVFNDTAYDVIAQTVTNSMADVAIVFVSAFTEESVDRATLYLDRDGEALIETVAAGCNNTIVVIHAGAPVLSGDAIANVLFGDVSPSGKLPYTIGHSLDEYPPNTISDDPFGYGLSYSTVYEADNSTIQKTNEPFEVTAQVTNTGTSLHRKPLSWYPWIWLRGFDKLRALSPGETRTATFALRRKDFSLWSTERQLWYVPEGDIQLQVGASSTKLYLTSSWSS
ncbi:glycoside hydrolase [Fomitopsis serialis]|uniref:glycoside hydrolase n=1 Tax=Fomitopsis serialis TaxID=139415 RepID=UPI0020088977|nr:glycoside hydrolase [Neoantrodia serialis]KAH9931535.1 glycoside hydrolase [Neoantrodia serialis]